MNNAVTVLEGQALLDEASKADLNTELASPAEEQEANTLARYASEMAVDKPLPCGC
jgi:hypothetical protein